MKIDLHSLQRKLELAKSNVLAPVRQMIDWHQAQITELQSVLQSLGGVTSNGPARIAKYSATKKPRRDKRVRRSAEDLKALAEQVHAEIKEAGSEGITGRELRKKFANLPPILKDFFKQHGLAVRTRGQKSLMRYFA